MEFSDERRAMLFVHLIENLVAWRSFPGRKKASATFKKFCQYAKNNDIKLDARAFYALEMLMYITCHKDASGLIVLQSIFPYESQIPLFMENLNTPGNIAVIGYLFDFFLKEKSNLGLGFLFHEKCLLTDYDQFTFVRKMINEPKIIFSKKSSSSINSEFEYTVLNIFITLFELKVLKPEDLFSANGKENVLSVVLSNPDIDIKLFEFFVQQMVKATMLLENNSEMIEKLIESTEIDKSLKDELYEILTFCKMDQYQVDGLKQKKNGSMRVPVVDITLQ